MAEKFVALGIHAATPLVQNYDTILDRGKDGFERITRRRTVREVGDRSAGYDDNRRSSVGSYGNSRGTVQRTRRDDRYDSTYDSEGSIPPRNRQRTGSARDSRRPQDSDSYSYSYTGSSSETEELPASTDDEKEEQKKRRGELLTGGIAAVASLHAAANIWGSVKAREARKKKVKDGSMTEKEAKVEQRKAQFQDAAALGLAALSLKGAYGKWQGTISQRKARKEHQHHRRQRHEKRLEKGISRQNEHRNENASQYRSKKHGDDQFSATAVARPGYNRAYSRSVPDVSSRNNHYQPSRRQGGKSTRSRRGGDRQNDYGAYDEDYGGDEGDFDA